MSKSVIKGILICSLSFAIPSGMTLAQAKSAKPPAQDPQTYMHVHAPYAQSLVVKVKAAHDDQIVKLGSMPFLLERPTT
jgi:hypothetical protein